MLTFWIIYWTGVFATFVWALARMFVFERAKTVNFLSKNDGGVIAIVIAALILSLFWFILAPAQFVAEVKK